MVTGAVGERSRAANLEVKSFDLSANPYLVVAGTLAAGLPGVTGQAVLGEPVDADPTSLPGSPRLPTSLAEAVAAFDADTVLADTFGAEFAATIVDVRRGEIALFADATPEEVVALTRWKH